MRLQDSEDDAEVQIGPAARARLYRQRAAELQAAIADTDLPRVQEKYREAAERYLALATAEETVAARGESGVARRVDPASIALGPLLEFLRARPASRD